ncbi:MAG: polysaccharide deacetylase family protein [Kiritimatiellae bacterium]|nr:polysaccharide deacetylase family protein [Kiritimatiellia bacterium]
MTEIKSIMDKARCLAAAFAAAFAAAAGAADFSVRDFGAKGDGAAKDTAAIQRAVDAAHAAGGGRAVIPAGTYLSGTVWLKDGVELRLEKGAVLKGSTDRRDYNANDCFPENFWSDSEEWSGGHLVVAYKAENVAITGEGVIDGSGPAFFPPECDEDSHFPHWKYGLKLHPVDRDWFRPGPMVAMFLTKNIRLEGVTLKDPPCWTAHFRCCDGLDVRNVAIDADRTIANSDGFSIDCTRNVTVSGCTIKVGDDGFAIRASCKHHAAERPCENIRISDCDVWTCCWGVRFGVGTGTIRNATVENCRFHEGAEGVGFTPAWVAEGKNVYIEDIVVRDCEMLECAYPVRFDGPKADARMRGILFENCRMESIRPCRIDGTEQCHAEDVTFRNCTRRHLERFTRRNNGKWAQPRSRKFAEFKGPREGVRFENCRPSDEPVGTLVLSFDDRNLGDWKKALPLFDKYGAHVTFFVCGEIDGDTVKALKELRAHGHSIGLHGLRHANADSAIAQMGAERYFETDILPQLERLRVSWIPVTSFAYPNCRSTEESDALFKAKGFAHVRGGHKGVAPFDPKGEKQAGLKPIHTVDRAFFPAAELGSRFRLDTVIAGEAYHTDIEDILACIRRCAERREAFVLTSHGISPGAKGINMKTEWLERILATARECGVAVVGFDEIPAQ